MLCHKCKQRIHNWTDDGLWYDDAGWAGGTLTGKSEHWHAHRPARTVEYVLSLRPKVGDR